MMLHTHTHTHTRVCVCLCMCACTMHTYTCANRLYREDAARMYYGPSELLHCGPRYRCVRACVCMHVCIFTHMILVWAQVEVEAERCRVASGLVPRSAVPGVPPVSAHAHAHVHTHACTRTHARTHARTHTHTHTHEMHGDIEMSHDSGACALLRALCA